MRTDWLLRTLQHPAWVLLAMMQAGAAPATEPPYDAGLRHIRVEIRTHEGRHWFNVSVADSQALQEKGLMFVRTLPENAGMLFPERVPRMMTMWMKNTLIPLDMLFIDDTGRIACLRERAVPESLTIIGCDRPVAEVLEIGGGQAARRHITMGDTVVHAPIGGKSAR